MTDERLAEYSKGKIQGAMYTETFTNEVPCPSPIIRIRDGLIQDPAAPGSVDSPAKSLLAFSAVAALAVIGAPGTISLTPVSSATGAPSSVVSSTSSTTGHASASRPTLGSDGLEACAKEGAFAMTLEKGILKDQQGRTGYIAANYQFQFDGPPQAGAIITAGFSICANGSLALGGSNVFYQCLSGSFYNLYDRYWAGQCSPITINIIKLKQC